LKATLIGEALIELISVVVGEVDADVVEQHHYTADDEKDPPQNREGLGLFLSSAVVTVFLQNV